MSDANPAGRSSPSDVVLKDIKNIHLSVYPPNGRVRISAPAAHEPGDHPRLRHLQAGLDQAAADASSSEQERETPREYLERESHYVWGKRYLLQVVEIEQPPSVELKHSHLLLQVRPGADEKKKQAVMDEWYRRQVRLAVPTADRQLGSRDGGEGAQTSSCSA